MSDRRVPPVAQFVAVVIASAATIGIIALTDPPGGGMSAWTLLVGFVLIVSARALGLWTASRPLIGRADVLLFGWATPWQVRVLTAPDLRCTSWSWRSARRTATCGT